MSRFWLYILKNDYWDKLSIHYAKKKFHIFSFTMCNELKENDYVFIYQKHTSPLKHGFVAGGKIGYSLKLNDKKIRVFSDINTHKNITEFKEVYILNNIIKVSSFEKILEKTIDKTLQNFKTKYLKTLLSFVEIPTNLGKEMKNMFCDTNNNYKKIINNEINNGSDSDDYDGRYCAFEYGSDVDKSENSLDDNNSNHDDDDDDEDDDDDDGYDNYGNNFYSNSDNNKNESDKEKKKSLFSDSDSDNDSNNKINDSASNNSDVESSASESESEVEGNIPVLMVPCHKFKWSDDDDDENKNQIIYHYKTCKKCDKTNNNSNDIIFDEFKTKYVELDDEDDINMFMNYYLCAKEYDKNLNNKIYIYKINDDSHQYYESIIILYP
jgi:hypothetical protein